MQGVGQVHLNTDLNADQAVPVAFAAVSIHQVDVFLNRLAPGSRREQAQALHAIAKLLTNGCSDARGLNWASLRYPQTAAVRPPWSSDMPRIRHACSLAWGVEGVLAVRPDEP